MAIQDLRFGTYSSEFEILSNLDSTKTVRKMSRCALASVEDPRVRLLRALSDDKPARLLIPQAVHGQPNEPLNEFYELSSSTTLEDARFIFEELIAQQRTKEPQIVAMMSQLARAAAYIHGHGLVHGDIRPSNIFLDGTPENPQLTLFDYSSVCTPHVPTDLTPSWNEEHPNDPYIDFRFDVYSIGKIFHSLTRARTGGLHEGLDNSHPVYEIIAAATNSFEKRPGSAQELQALLESIQ